MAAIDKQGELREDYHIMMPVLHQHLDAKYSSEEGQSFRDSRPGVEVTPTGLLTPDMVSLKDWENLVNFLEGYELENGETTVMQFIYVMDFEGKLRVTVDIPQENLMYVNGKPIRKVENRSSTVAEAFSGYVYGSPIPALPRHWMLADRMRDEYGDAPDDDVPTVDFAGEGLMQVIKGDDGSLKLKIVELNNDSGAFLPQRKNYKDNLVVERFKKSGIEVRPDPFNLKKGLSEMKIIFKGKEYTPPRGQNWAMFSEAFSGYLGLDENGLPEFGSPYGAYSKFKEQDDGSYVLLIGNPDNEEVHVATKENVDNIAVIVKWNEEEGFTFENVDAQALTIAKSA